MNHLNLDWISSHITEDYMCPNYTQTVASNRLLISPRFHPTSESPVQGAFLSFFFFFIQSMSPSSWSSHTCWDLSITESQPATAMQSSSVRAVVGRVVVLRAGRGLRLLEKTPLVVVVVDCCVWAVFIIKRLTFRLWIRPQSDRNMWI